MFQIILMIAIVCLSQSALISYPKDRAISSMQSVKALLWCNIKNTQNKSNHLNSALLHRICRQWIELPNLINCQSCYSALIQYYNKTLIIAPFGVSAEEHTCSTDSVLNSVTINLEIGEAAIENIGDELIIAFGVN